MSISNVVDAIPAPIITIIIKAVDNGAISAMRGNIVFFLIFLKRFINIAIAI